MTQLVTSQKTKNMYLSSEGLVFSQLTLLSRTDALFGVLERSKEMLRVLLLLSSINLMLKEMPQLSMLAHGYGLS